MGHIYEKRIIEKYLETHDGKCPHTGEPLAAADLIAVKGSLRAFPIAPVLALSLRLGKGTVVRWLIRAASKIGKVRPAAATSVPGLLQLMQNEWDALMLETFTLKQQLDTVRPSRSLAIVCVVNLCAQVRQELAQSLYQHDASCRVIARLVKERDEARSALANMKVAVSGGGAVVASEPAAPAAAAMEVDAKANVGIPEAIGNRIVEKATELQGQRKKRVIPDSLAKPEDIAAYKVSADFPGMHSASAPGILCVDLSADHSQVVTGGVDKTGVVLDRNSGKEVAKLTGHTGRVLDVLFHPTEPLILTASADATVVGWTPETKNRKKTYKAAHTFAVHKADVTGIAIHPLSDFVASASADRSWALHDVRAGTTLHRFVDTAPQGGYHSVGFHPDGLLLGLGAADHNLQLWEVKAQQCVVNFTGHKGPVTAVSFSENGYYLATASTDNTVHLWDMRKRASIASHAVDGLSTVRFDHSGSYVLAGGATGPVYVHVPVVFMACLLMLCPQCAEDQNARGCAPGEGRAPRYGRRVGQRCLLLRHRLERPQPQVLGQVSGLLAGQRHCGVRGR